MDKFHNNNCNVFISKPSGKNDMLFPEQLKLRIHVPRVKSLKGLIYKSINVKYWLIMNFLIQNT